MKAFMNVQVKQLHQILFASYSCENDKINLLREFLTEANSEYATSKAAGSTKWGRFFLNKYGTFFQCFLGFSFYKSTVMLLRFFTLHTHTVHTETLF